MVDENKDTSNEQENSSPEAEEIKREAEQQVTYYFTKNDTINSVLIENMRNFLDFIEYNAK
mgnify:CR=1 FL=1